MQSILTFHKISRQKKNNNFPFTIQKKKLIQNKNIKYYINYYLNPPPHNEKHPFYVVAVIKKL